MAKSDYTRNFVVTGGATGIGRATAEMLVDDGASVCLVGRRDGLLKDACEALGPSAWWVAADVADERSVYVLANEVRSRWGQVNGLVNNAGIAPMADLESTEVDVWDSTFAINVRGPYLVSRALLPQLRTSESGSIVNVSSTLAVRAIPGMAAYNASKAALNQLTRSMALELAPEIRVNAVMPAVVDTPIHAGRGMSSEDVQGLGGIHPMQRVGRPEDVAATIVFLLSRESAWTTGALVPVDGGMLAG